MENSRRHLLGCIALCALLAPLCSSAAVNKCTDANGKVTYQQQPCASGAKTQTWSTSAAVSGGGGYSSWELVASDDRSEVHTEHLLDVGGARKIGAITAIKAKRVSTPRSSERNPDAAHPITDEWYFFFDCAAKTKSDAVDVAELNAPGIDGSLEKLSQRVSRSSYDLANYSGIRLSEADLAAAEAANPFDSRKAIASVCK